MTPLEQVQAEDGHGVLLRLVPLGGRRVPLYLDETGPLVYVSLASGAAVSVSDANDAVGLMAMLHPDDGGEGLPTRYLRLDGVEVVEVETPEGALLVPSALVPYDDRGGATVGR